MLRFPLSCASPRFVLLNEQTLIFCSCSFLWARFAMRQAQQHQDVRPAPQAAAATQSRPLPAAQVQPARPVSAGAFNAQVQGRPDGSQGVPPARQVGSAFWARCKPTACPLCCITFCLSIFWGLSRIDDANLGCASSHSPPSLLFC